MQILGAIQKVFNRNKYEERIATNLYNMQGKSVDGGRYIDVVEAFDLKEYAARNDYARQYIHSSLLNAVRVIPTGTSDVQNYYRRTGEVVISPEAAKILYPDIELKVLPRERPVASPSTPAASEGAATARPPSNSNTYSTGPDEPSRFPDNNVGSTDTFGTESSFPRDTYNNNGGPSLQ